METSDSSKYAEDILEKCTIVRAFVSFDLVNSTSYKQSKTNANDQSHSAWALTFLEFIKETKEQVKLQWDFLKRKCPDELDGEPEFWQFRGDELIFTKQLSNSHGFVNSVALAYWAYKVCENLRENLLSKPNHKGLDVKVTIWIAGFPVNNFEVYFSEVDELELDIGDTTLNKMLKIIGEKRLVSDRKEPQVKDLTFLGPSIDLGFRLCTLSDRRRCVISADYAYILARGMDNKKGDYKEFCKAAEISEDLYISYERDEGLKGISLRDYPVIWLDFESDKGQKEKNELKDKLVQKIGSNSKHEQHSIPLKEVAEQLSEYLELVLTNEDAIRTKPYFVGNDKIPSIHVKKRKDLKLALIKMIEEKTEPVGGASLELPKDAKVQAERALKGTPE